MTGPRWPPYFSRTSSQCGVYSLWPCPNSKAASEGHVYAYTGTPSRWTPLEKHTAKEKYPEVLREVFPNVLNVVMSNKSLIRLNTSGCRRLKSCQFYTYAYQNLLGHVFNHPRSNNWSRSPNDRPIGVGFEAG